MPSANILIAPRSDSAITNRVPRSKSRCAPPGRESENPFTNFPCSWHLRDLGVSWWVPAAVERHHPPKPDGDRRTSALSRRGNELHRASGMTRGLPGSAWLKRQWIAWREAAARADVCNAGGCDSPGRTAGACAALRPCRRAYKATNRWVAASPSSARRLLLVLLMPSSCVCSVFVKPGNPSARSAPVTGSPATADPEACCAARRRRCRGRLHPSSALHLSPSFKLHPQPIEFLPASWGRAGGSQDGNFGHDGGD